MNFLNVFFPLLICQFIKWVILHKILIKKLKHGVGWLLYFILTWIFLIKDCLMQSWQQQTVLEEAFTPPPSHTQKGVLQMHVDTELWEHCQHVT